MAPKYEYNLEEIIKEVENISKKLRGGDFITAAFTIETLPKEINKDPLYAGLAIYLTGMMENEEIGKEAKKLIERMRDFYLNKCSYFKNK